MIDEDPLAQPETSTQPQPLTEPQTFSARAPQTQDLPTDHAEEETVEAYLKRLLASAPWRNSLPRHLGDTPSEDADFEEAQTANLLDHLQQPPPAERRPSADRGRYIVEAPKKKYHCIVCYCIQLNTAVLPCGYTICTDCAGKISRCPLDRTVFVGANTPVVRAVQDAVQKFLLSEGARTARVILAAAGAAIFSLGSTTRPLTNPDAMRQARFRAFMHLLPPDPPGELAADPPGEPAAVLIQNAPRYQRQQRFPERWLRWTLSGCDSRNGSAKQCSVVWSGLSSHVQQLEHWCTSCSTMAGTRAWPVAVVLNSAMKQDFPGAASASGVQPATTKVS